MIDTIDNRKLWNHYELIDCGKFLKLERFGSYILVRPEPQAVWNPTLSDEEWKKLAHAEFVQKSSYSGIWNKYKKIPDQWNLNYKSGDLNLTFKLALTGFKHVGIFPEQADNWNYIYINSLAYIRKFGKNPSFLNLFAYTGGASLAAKAAGADVVHVDSIKQVVTWANGNRELSGLSDIRWIIDDAVKFVKREIKRGKIYQGIALDPPSYGIGTQGERWKLDEQINDLIEATSKLLDQKNGFYVLNCYSGGFSALSAENLLRQHFEPALNIQLAEICMSDSTEKKLPLGIVGRLTGI